MRLCTGCTAYRGSRGTALPFLDRGTRRGEGSASRLGRFYPRKDPVLIVQKAGWASGPVWAGVENLAPNGIRSPDHPARSQSLYRLRYPKLGRGYNIQIIPLAIWIQRRKNLESNLNHFKHGDTCRFGKRKTEIGKGEEGKEQGIINRRVKLK